LAKIIKKRDYYYGQREKIQNFSKINDGGKSQLDKQNA